MQAERGSGEMGRVCVCTCMRIHMNTHRVADGGGPQALAKGGGADALSQAVCVVFVWVG